jgi:hypothetical protein
MTFGTARTGTGISSARLPCSTVVGRARSADPSRGSSALLLAAIGIALMVVPYFVRL